MKYMLWDIVKTKQLLERAKTFQQSFKAWKSSVIITGRLESIDSLPHNQTKIIEAPAEDIDALILRLSQLELDIRNLISMLIGGLQ